jgi:hypothetical protein
MSFMAVVSSRGIVRPAARSRLVGRHSAAKPFEVFQAVSAEPSCDQLVLYSRIQTGGGSPVGCLRSVVWRGPTVKSEMIARGPTPRKATAILRPLVLSCYGLSPRARLGQRAPDHSSRAPRRGHWVRLLRNPFGFGATPRTASNRASPRRNFCGPNAAHHRSWIYDSTPRGVGEWQAGSVAQLLARL